MKHVFKAHTLRLLTLLAGAAGLALRLWQLNGAIDEKGLIITSHPSGYLLLALTALAALAFVLCSRLVTPGSYPKRYPRSLPAAFGFWAAAILLAVFSVLQYLASKALSPLNIVVSVLSIAAALCLIFLGFCRQKPRRPIPLFHGIFTFFLMIFLLSRYPAWSAQPQLALCAFEALATISLLLSAYYRTALDAKQQTWSIYLFFNMLTVFFCCLSLIGQDRLFYLAMLLWATANTPVLRIHKAAPQDSQETMHLPQSVLLLIRALEKAGFEAYAVGGCVRDSLLGLTPHDYDLCTSATPEEICTVFADRKLVRNGEKHGTMGVVTEDGVLEITTFRAEGTYSDNRHPDWVAFVSNLEDDLKRRDFTVNAIAYAPGKGYMDPYNGREDLENKTLRTVGEPEARFREDALRILRGVRFALRYRLTPEEETEKAMTALAPLMDSLARERVFEELCKILSLATLEDLVHYTPILTQVIPELAPCVDFDQHSIHHNYDVYTHTAQVVAAVPEDLTLRWAALLHDIGKPSVFTLDEQGQGHFLGHAAASAEQADAILRRLKAPTALREQVVFLVAQHMTPPEPDKHILLHRLGKFGETALRQLLTLQRADFGSKGTGEETDIFTQTEQLLDQLLQEQSCISAKDLAVNGRDILALGVDPGPLVGECMRFLLEQVQNEALINEHDTLLEAAANYLEAAIRGSDEPSELTIEEDLL